MVGLLESVIEVVVEIVWEKGVNGWVFILYVFSYIFFMMYVDNWDLCCEFYMVYNIKCIYDNEYNNLEIVKKIVNIYMEIV